MMNQHLETKKGVQKPRWLRRCLPTGPTYGKVSALLSEGQLHTVCREAKCPNQWECFSHRTATFLIMGSRCTRNCRFCAVAHGPLETPDIEEPARVAKAAHRMGLGYVVNIETVSRLYPLARAGAVYQRSLELLKRVKKYEPSIPTKSGLMLGLGESAAEINETLKDLLEVGCQILTLGQYLQPTKKHLPVERFILPDEFDVWRETALKMGFSEVASGPFVRSSYHAKELYLAVRD